MQLYPDLVNREALLDELLRVFKKDNDEIKLSQGQAQAQQQQTAQGQGGGIANQLVNQATGNKQTGAQPSLTKLQQ